MAQKQHLYYFYDQFSKEKRVSIKFQQNTTYSDPTFWLKNRSAFSISLFFFVLFLCFFNENFLGLICGNHEKDECHLTFDACFHERQTCYFLSYKSL